MGSNVVCSAVSGNAKASISGTDDRQFPRFFMFVLNLMHDMLDDGNRRQEKCAIMVSEHTLIANSGIQIFTIPLSINTQEKFKMWYHEWYDTTNGEWVLEPVYELRTEDECVYYNKQKLYTGGYLADPTIEIDVNELKTMALLLYVLMTRIVLE